MWPREGILSSLFVLAVSLSSSLYPLILFLVLEVHFLLSPLFWTCFGVLRPQSCFNFSKAGTTTFPALKLTLRPGLNRSKSTTKQRYAILTKFCGIKLSISCWTTSIRLGRWIQWVKAVLKVRGVIILNDFRIIYMTCPVLIHLVIFWAGTSREGFWMWERNVGFGIGVCYFRSKSRIGRRFRRGEIGRGF